MTSPNSDRDPVERLAEEFAERYRRGERPSLTEYTDKYPELAEQIRELFPTLAAIEEFGSVGDSSPTRAPPAGATLPRLGEYQILREVGRGGMGVVYEAVQEPLGRHVALKVLPFHGSMNAVYRERFRREAQAAAKLHHTNIVPVFGVGEHHGVHYYAMQFIQGQPLDQVLQEVRRLREQKAPAPLREPPTEAAPSPPTDANATHSLAFKVLTGSFPAANTVAGDAPREAAAVDAPPADRPPSESQSAVVGQTEAQYSRTAARMGLQVAEALHHAHQHGILHRDIKPSNLMLDSEGAVWVTDFGLVKMQGLEDLTHSGDFVGTLRYMAPERFRGASDARSDVYGLGVTLYELLTLRPAFEGGDRSQLIYQVTHEPPPRPRQIDPRIPRDLETIILKAMAQEPGDRYPTARAMAEDFRRFLEDRPIRARRASVVERAWRWRRRNPVLAGIGMVAAAALAATVILSLSLAYQQSRLADERTKAAARIEHEQQETLAALKGTERLSADLAVDKGLSVCEKGEVGPGMLRLADCLGLTRKAETADLEEGVRLNLAAWRRELSPLRMVVEHTASVTCVAFSPDGKTLLTGSRDGTARRWDAVTGEPVGDPLRQLGVVRGVAWSHDGKTIATGGGDDKVGQAWLWDAVTGQRLPCQLHPPAEVRGVAFRPDDKAFLTGGVDGAAQVWDVATGEPIGKLLRHPAGVEAVAWSKDGKTILTACHDGTARLWHAAAGEPGPVLKGHEGEVWAAAFSPDDKTIVTSGMDETVRLWDAEGRPVGAPLEIHTAIVVAAFSPDGRTLMTGGASGALAFWRVDTRQPVGRPLKHPAGLQAAAFAPDGKTVLTGCKDGMARLWEVAPASAVAVPLPGQDRKPLAAVFRPDGKAILTGGVGGDAWLADAATGRPLSDGPLRHKSDVEVVGFSRDGRTALTGGTGGNVRLWHASSGKPLEREDGRPLLLPHTGEIYAAAFSPDGRTVVTADSTGAVSFWVTAKGTPSGKTLPYLGRMQTLVFCSDGSILLTGIQDGTAQLWDANTGKPLSPPLPTPQGCWSAAFSPDDRTCVTGSLDGAAQLWEPTAGKAVGPALEHRGPIRAVAFSPDGQTLLTGGDGSARLWHAPTYKAIGPPLPLPGQILATAFTPDRATLLLSNGWEVSRIPAPVPVQGEPERVVRWTQVITGMELDADGVFRPLDGPTWRRRRQRLDQLGGPPVP